NNLNKEIEELRAKVDAQKRLKARLLLAVRLSNSRTAASEARLEKLRFLSTVKDTVSLPEEIQTLLNRVTSLPPAPPPTIDAPDPTKPVWTTHAGYMDWAVKTTVERDQASGKGSGKGKTKEATMIDAEEELRTFGEAGDLLGARRMEE
ncbi:hypothetical protein FRC00_012448, partial [Tulasnella sp. 408]